MNSQLVPGIIGGMGPEATIDLMNRIYINTVASDDSGHLRVLVDNNPKIPSRIKAIIEGTGESPAPCMIAMGNGLINQGADFLVIPCNTAHYYYGEVSKSLSVPVVNLLEITVEEIKKNNNVRVGLLGSTALRIVNLYDPVFTKYGLIPIYPEDDYQEKLMDLIKAVKANNITKEHLDFIPLLLNHMKTKNIDSFAIVCTELSVIKSKIISDLPIFDASEILTMEIIKRATKIKPNL